MAARKEDIPATDPDEKALDGTKDGKLDPNDPTDNVVQIDRGQLAEIETNVREAAATITDAIKTKRDELNAEKKKLLSALEADYHLNPVAFDAALKRSLLNEKKQAEFDLTYNICCKALGVDQQDDLFED